MDSERKLKRLIANLLLVVGELHKLRDELWIAYAMTTSSKDTAVDYPIPEDLLEDTEEAVEKVMEALGLGVANDKAKGSTTIIRPSYEEEEKEQN